MSNSNVAKTIDVAGIRVWKMRLKEIFAKRKWESMNQLHHSFVLSHSKRSDYYCYCIDGRTQNFASLTAESCMKTHSHRQRIIVVPKPSCLFLFKLFSIKGSCSRGSIYSIWSKIHLVLMLEIFVCFLTAQSQHSYSFGNHFPSC